MIELVDVSKKFDDHIGTAVVFENLNIRVAQGDRVAVLGGPRSGKSTLLKLMCGTQDPTSGTINRVGTVSWPIPVSKFLSQWNRVKANITFIARLYDVNPEDMVEKVSEMAEIKDYLGILLADCPKFVKVQLAFAIGVCLEFDTYLFEERIGVGKKAFRKKAVEIADVLSRDHGILFATSSVKSATEFCRTAYVLEDGSATYYSDIKSAIRHFRDIKSDDIVDPLDKEDEDDEDDPYTLDPDQEEGDI